MINKITHTLVNISFIIFVFLTGCATKNSIMEKPNQSEETKIVTYGLFLQPVLGIVIDSDGKILHVEPGSAAEIAGLMYGDLLISIDGSSIISEREKVRELIRSNTEDREMEIQYQRGEKVFMAQITPSQQMPQSTDQVPKLTPTPVLPPEDYL